jgi:hypothetical protein
MHLTHELETARFQPLSLDRGFPGVQPFCFQLVPLRDGSCVLGVAAVKEPKKGGDLGVLAAKAGEELGVLVETGAAVVGLCTLNPVDP